MTCTRCGAGVGALDTTCGSCGAPLPSRVRVPFGPPTRDGAVDGGSAQTAPAQSVVEPFVPGAPPSPRSAASPAPVTPPTPGTSAALEAPASRETGTRVRADRPTKILAVVAVVTFLAAIVTGVSRTQVAGQLADARTDLSSTTSQLAAASDQVDSLQQQTHDLEVAAEQLQTKLDDAQAEEKNTRTSLEACQDAWRLAADFARTGVFSKGEAATVASKIVSCFEGKVPPSIWGG